MAVEWIVEAKKERQQIEEQFWERVSKLWGSFEAFVRMEEYNRKRAELLNELYLIYPFVQIQYSDIKESFRSELLGYDWDLVYTAPVVHYRILPNEIVFDFDCSDKAIARKNLRSFAIMLKSLGIEPFIGFSGNRGYHVHVVFGPPRGELEDFVKAHGIREFRENLFEWFLSLAKSYNVKIELIDQGVMRAENHTIRSFYSFNTKGKRWKKPVYGEHYSIWRIPEHIYRNLLEMMKEKRQRKMLEAIITNELNEKKKNEERKGTIVWIEKLLQNPGIVSDGRKRMLLHLIIPYLLTVKGLSEAEAEEKCRAWLEATGVDYGKYKSFVKCEIRAVARKGILPMRREKFMHMYPDLKTYLDGKFFIP